MNSEKEQRVRELYNPKLKISENIRQIKASHPEIEYSENTIRSILRAKRLGFKSLNDNYEYLAREMGFKSRSEYVNNLIKNKGEFENHSKYVRHRKNIRTIKDLSEGDLDEIDKLLNKTNPDLVESILKIYQETQDNRDSEIEVADHKLFGSVIDESMGFFETERRERMLSLLEESINCLPERYAKLIRERFYLGKTLEEIGTKIGINRETIRRYEERALKELFYIAKQNKLYQEYAQL